MLVKLLKKGHDELSGNAGGNRVNYWNVISFLLADNAAQKLPLESYAIVLDCISVLTENLPDNMAILRDWGCMDWLLEMVQHPLTRPAALRLILHSVKLDTSIENSHGYDNPQLISTLTFMQGSCSVNPIASVFSKKCLCAEERHLKYYSKGFPNDETDKRLIPRKRWVRSTCFSCCGLRWGYAFVLRLARLIIWNIEFLATPPTVDLKEAMHLLDAVFKTATAAIAQHSANKQFFAEHIGMHFIAQRNMT